MLLTVGDREQHSFFVRKSSPYSRIYHENTIFAAIEV